MSDRSDQDIPSSPNVWKQMLDDHWEQQLANDDAEFEIDLLAAYAEGRLSAEEELEAQAVLARSPVALQCFLAMRDQVEEDLMSTRHTPSASISEGAISSRQSSGKVPGRLRSASGQFAIAASLIIAAVTTGWALSERSDQNILRSELAALRASTLGDPRVAQLEADIAELQQARAEAASLDNLLRQKEQGVMLASQRTPQFLAGRVSPGLLSTTLLEFPRARGGEPLTPAEQELRKAVSVRWTTAVQDKEFTKVSQQSKRVELAFEKLVMESPDEARLVLDGLKQESPQDPEIQNLEAVILLREATLSSSADQSSQKEASAKAILESITQNQPDFPNAWLNLGMLVERNAGRQNALVYWNRYLEIERDPDLIAVVRSMIE